MTLQPGSVLSVGSTVGASVGTRYCRSGENMGFPRVRSSSSVEKGQEFPSFSAIRGYTRVRYTQTDDR